MTTLISPMMTGSPLKGIPATQNFHSPRKTDEAALSLVSLSTLASPRKASSKGHSSEIPPLKGRCQATLSERAVTSVTAKLNTIARDTGLRPPPTFLCSIGGCPVTLGHHPLKKEMASFGPYRYGFAFTSLDELYRGPVADPQDFRNRKIDFHAFPCQDFFAPPLAQMVAFTRTLFELRKAPAYVFCKAGCGRSPFAMIFATSVAIALNIPVEGIASQNLPVRSPEELLQTIRSVTKQFIEKRGSINFPPDREAKMLQYLDGLRRYGYLKSREAFDSADMRFIDLIQESC